MAAHEPDPVERLTTVNEQLIVAEHHLQTAAATVDRLHNEPALRTLPAGGLDIEHRQWANDRAAHREAADRRAQARWQRQQQPHPIRPNHFGHVPLDHGPSIGR